MASYGIKVYDDQGYINLHSDYSSLVYYGTMAQSQTPVRPTYQGDYFIPISEGEKDSNYDMGFLTQYKITLPTTVDKILPFYHPSFDGQEVAIIDIVNDGGGVWVVNVLFSGSSSSAPSLFAFVDIKDIQQYVSSSGYGLSVWDASSDLIFQNQYLPLRVDGVAVITHPTNIKTGPRGTCTNAQGAECHINYTSDQTNTFNVGTTITPTKLFHVVPSTYGGLAYQNEGRYETTCGFLNLGIGKTRGRISRGHLSAELFKRRTIPRP